MTDLQPELPLDLKKKRKESKKEKEERLLFEYNDQKFHGKLGQLAQIMNKDR
jgi:hypothetical protein